MLANFRSIALPALRGPVLIDGAGLPRYWAAVWASFQPADLASSTIKAKLSRLENFYQHADAMLGPGGLDDALADFDVCALSNALEGYFLTIRNQPPITPASEERWQLALQFVTEIAQRLTRNSLTPVQLDALNVRLTALELLHAHLHVGKRRRPKGFDPCLLKSLNAFMKCWTQSPLPTRLEMALPAGAYTPFSY